MQQVIPIQVRAAQTFQSPQFDVSGFRDIKVTLNIHSTNKNDGVSVVTWEAWLALDGVNFRRRIFGIWTSAGGMQFTNKDGVLNPDPEIHIGWDVGQEFPVGSKLFIKIIFPQQMRIGATLDVN